MTDLPSSIADLLSQPGNFALATFAVFAAFAVLAVIVLVAVLSRR